MLIEFYGQNFGCFRDEFRLSMLATDIDPDSDRGVVEALVIGDDEPLRLLRAAAIYGPNASGKSTIVRAAAVLRYLIGRTESLRSDAALGRYEPFALDPGSREAPVRLGLKAVVEGRVYDYEIQFDHLRFLSERLTRFGVGTESVLFRREGQDVRGEWEQEDQFRLITKEFRPNALVLSLADRLAPSVARGIAPALRRHLAEFNMAEMSWVAPWDAPSIEIAERARHEPDFANWLLSQLQSADFGVTELRTEEEKVRIGIEGIVSPRSSRQAGDERHDPETIAYLLLLHRGAAGKPYTVPYARESNGTKTFITLAPLLHDLALGESAAAAFVDEIEQSLHPTLLQGLLRHFNCEVPLAEARGQLVFATHDTSLLDAEAKNAILRRDQIYFTEKDEDGAARLYSLAEFRERNNLNIRRRYLQGRYGALPTLGRFGE